MKSALPSYLVVNPRAAHGHVFKAKETWWCRPKVRSWLQTHDIRLLVTDSLEDLATTLEGLLRQHETMNLLSYGGDGSQHHMVNTLMRQGALQNTKARLALRWMPLPGGTGSDFCRHFNMSLKLEALTQRLYSKGSPIDVGEVTWRSPKKDHDTHTFFINSCSFGIPAEVSRLTQSKRYNKLGRLKYFLGALSALRNYQPLNMPKQEGLRHDGPYAAVIVANGKYFGGGMQIAPRAQVDDGLFDLTWVEDASALHWATRLPRVYGSHLEDISKIHLSKHQRLHFPLNRSEDRIDLDGETYTGFIASVQNLTRQLTMI